jgi:glycosyltransferase involved in cell wall biosynthesis
MSVESSHGTVLFVSPSPGLVTPASGEGTRLKHLSQELAEKWDVLALVPESAADTRPEWVRRQYTYKQWSLPFLTDLNPSFVRVLTRVLRRERVDVVHLSHGVCVARVLSALVRTGTVVNHASQNVEAEHAQDFVDPELPVYKRLLGPRLIPVIERATVRCADCVTTVSDADRITLRERYGVDEARIRTIPTGTTVVDPSSLKSRDAVRDCYGLADGAVGVFHGSYAHPPNAEAVEWLVETVAPAVRERGVDVEFLLVGRGMPEVDDPDLRTAGFVDDLFSTLGAADFAVVPILHGGGTKTKIYDYLSIELPVVSTATGVDGIDVEDGVHGVVTKGVNEAFVDGVVRLAEDDELRGAFARNVRELATERTWTRSGKWLSSFYARLLETR